MSAKNDSEDWKKVFSYVRTQNVQQRKKSHMMHQVIDKRKHNVSRLFSETRERKTQREKAVDALISYTKPVG